VVTAGTSTTTGTNRIDNIVVSGTAIPAPGALALLGVAGLIGARRRR
jgi:MYXO-CTERM domain-containing protein